MVGGEGQLGPWDVFDLELFSHSVSTRQGLAHIWMTLVYLQVAVRADVVLRLLEEHQPRHLAFRPPLVIHDFKGYLSAPCPVGGLTLLVPGGLPDVVVIGETEVMGTSDRRGVSRIQGVVGQVTRYHMHFCSRPLNRFRLEKPDRRGESDDAGSYDDYGPGGHGLAIVGVRLG